MRPERLAATSAGCTIASRTASNSATITWAWVAACSAWVASTLVVGLAAAAVSGAPIDDPMRATSGTAVTTNSGATLTNDIETS